MSATESPEKKDAGESVKEKDDAKKSRFILFIGNYDYPLFFEIQFGHLEDQLWFAPSASSSGAVEAQF